MSDTNPDGGSGGGGVALAAPDPAVIDPNGEAITANEIEIASLFCRNWQAFVTQSGLTVENGSLLDWLQKGAGVPGDWTQVEAAYQGQIDLLNTRLAEVQATLESAQQAAQQSAQQSQSRLDVAQTSLDAASAQHLADAKALAEAQGQIAGLTATSAAQSAQIEAQAAQLAVQSQSADAFKTKVQGLVQTILAGQQAATDLQALTGAAGAAPTPIG